MRGGAKEGERKVNDRNIKSRGIGRLALTRGEIIEDEGSQQKGTRE